MGNIKCIRKLALFAGLGIILLISALSCVIPTGPSTVDSKPESSSSVKPPVIVAFEVSPTKVTIVEQVTLSWKVTGATTVTIDPDIGKVASSGTRDLVPAHSTNYKLTATNQGGNVTRTASVTVYENESASKIALTDDDVGSSGYVFRQNFEPQVDDTISTYYVKFVRPGALAGRDEILDNAVSIHTAVAAAEKRYIDIKAGTSTSISDFVAIGDEGYLLKFPGVDQTVPDTYVIRFRKNNVYVNVGTLMNYEQLESFARIVESRIK